MNIHDILIIIRKIYWFLFWLNVWIWVFIKELFKRFEDVGQSAFTWRYISASLLRLVMWFTRRHTWEFCWRVLHIERFIFVSMATILKPAWKHIRALLLNTFIHFWLMQLLKKTIHTNKHFNAGFRAKIIAKDCIINQKTSWLWSESSKHQVRLIRGLWFGDKRDIKDLPPLTGRFFSLYWFSVWIALKSSSAREDMFRSFPFQINIFIFKLSSQPPRSKSLSIALLLSTKVK